MQGFFYQQTVWRPTLGYHFRFDSLKVVSGKTHAVIRLT